MYKIAVLGDKDSVMGFRALGVDVIYSEPQDGAKTLKRLAREDYAIIFVCEQLAAEMADEIDAYRDSLRPAVILIPNNSGSLGLGMAKIKSNIERAVGADII